jgi:hypothetical protein
MLKIKKKGCDYMLYVLRNYEIYHAELIKPSRKNKGWWCRLNNYKKLKLVSLSNMFDTFEDANIMLEKLKLRLKNNK